MSEPTAIALPDAPALRLAWLTPRRCRLIFVLFIAAVFIGHLYYLHHCPIDLGADEAQYWDWSRNLDLSYYSKGPLIAYIIRASCAMFGETMPAVRYPALVIAAATSLVTYLLVLKLFGSDRLALGTVLLFALTPLMIVGGVLITIDPPMFLCWALATYLAAVAIFDDRPGLWIAIGILVGIGFLAKYVALVWYAGAFGFLLVNRRGRGLKGAIVALAISLLFTAPVIVWNARHDWVSFRHVATQTGTSGGTFSMGNVGFFVVGVLATIGPALSWIMGGAVLHALRPDPATSGDHRPKLLFLAGIGLPLLAINGIWSFRTKIQFNWPAPAYFTLIILSAYFLGTRLQSIRAWRRWRGWFWATVAIGLILIPFVHDTSPMLPHFQRIAKAIDPKADDFDPLARLRGWRELGKHVSSNLKELGEDAFVLCDDYQQTAEMAFYVVGQPKTYCAGFYFGKRMTQYDIWPDRRLDPSSPLIGRNAVYVGKGTTGKLPPQVEAAFHRIERLPLLDIEVNGVRIRHFATWRCYGFLGMNPPKGTVDF